MVYSVKEIFYSIQGEGAHTGRPSVFIRFAGCNLWSGREQDRKTAICSFCDTDITGTDGKGGGRFENAKDLAKTANSYWPNVCDNKWVVCTGGEPLLQLDDKLIAALHEYGFKIAIETNGTISAPKNIDWICVSPKANAKLVQTKGDELKLVFPQKQNKPTDFEGLEFTHFSLQPLEEAGKNHIAATLKYCLDNPKWRLSLQTHKTIGVR